MLMHYFGAVIFLVVLFLKEVFSSLSKASPVDTMDIFLARLPEEILLEGIASFVGPEIRFLMGTNKAIRKTFLNLTALSKYLARIYSLPSLDRIPFNPALLKLKPLSLEERTKSPEDLNLKLASSVGKLLYLDQIILSLFDFFAEARGSISHHGNPEYSKHVAKLILKNRSLAFYERIRAKFEFPVDFSGFDDIYNSIDLFSKWFLNEYDVFTRIFFAPTFRWNDSLICSFLCAQGTKLPVELAPAEIGPFFKSFIDLMLDPFFENPEIEKQISEKGQEYFAVHASENPSLYEKFLIRFDPEYTCTMDQFDVVDRNLAILMCLGGKWDVAIEIIKLLDDSEYWDGLLLCRYKFCLYFLKNNTDLYRRLMLRIPDELYTEPAAIEAILKFYGARDIHSFLEGLEHLGLLEATNLVHFTDLFGSPDNFNAALDLLPNQNSTEILNIIIKLKKNSPDLLQFMERQRFNCNVLGLEALKSLLLRPEVLKEVQSFTRTSVGCYALIEITETEEYQNASDDTKHCLQQLLRKE